MTRKDYELLARTIRAERETAEAMHEPVGFAALTCFAYKLADALEHDNPSFQRATFYAACGI